MDWWKEKFINRRDYMLDHLDELTMTSDETLLIMLIDFLNQHQIPVTHGILAKKMKKDSGEIDDLLSQLSAKGYVQLTFQNGKILFEIDGVFAGAKEKTMNFDASLFDLFETEFARPLSQMEFATAGSKDAIIKMMGDRYVHPRHFETKTKGAQEAHEAIRPTYIENQSVEGTAQEKKLYDLIWKRTIASQMADAELEKTTVTISISSSSEVFTAIGEVIKFDGFLRVYRESYDDENEQEDESNLLPPLKKGQKLEHGPIVATERFTQRPPRYTEASLVRKLEELGIGRPSTYALHFHDSESRICGKR